ncbi:hypothetical protein Tco_0173025 [Tanacetum coccineum]
MYYDKRVRLLYAVQQCFNIQEQVAHRLDGNNTSIFKQGETYGSNMSRPMIKFVKESGCPNAIKINNTENTRKPTVATLIIWHLIVGYGWLREKPGQGVIILKTM